MSDVKNFTEYLSSGVLWVCKNFRLRPARIVECRFDECAEEGEPIEKYLVEYYDNGNQELVHLNECTFVPNFALQRLIKNIEDNIEKQQDTSDTSDIYKAKMKELDGPIKCICNKGISKHVNRSGSHYERANCYKSVVIKDYTKPRSVAAVDPETGLPYALQR